MNATPSSLSPERYEVNVPAFLDALRSAGVTHVVGLPDTETGPVFDGSHLPPPRVICVCREAEALGIAAGLWAGGARPLVLIQSTGFFESGDCLRNLVHELEVPLDIAIGYRGHSGKLNAGTPDTAREFLEPLLAAWRLPSRTLRNEDYGALAQALRDGAARDCGARAFLLPQ